MTRFSKIIVVTLALIGLMAGCANTAVLATNANQFQGKTVTLVPTGVLKIETRSEGVSGAPIGALGAFLITAALSSDPINVKGADVVENENALDKIGNEIAASIESSSMPKAIKFLPHSIQNTSFPDWFNSGARAEMSQNNSGEIFVDYGFQGLSLTSYLAGTYAEATIGIRVIEARTGAVIARARTSGFGAFGGEKVVLSGSEDAATKARVVADAFSKVIKRVTTEAIGKVGLQAAPLGYHLRQTPAAKRAAAGPASQQSNAPVAGQTKQGAAPNDGSKVPYVDPQLTPSVVLPQSGTLSSPKSRAAQRLRELNELLRDGLIDKSDYESKKQEIIKDL